MDSNINSFQRWIQVFTPVIATIAVPATIFIVGNNIESSIKEREINAKYLEMAISILKEDPKTEDTKALREWAIRLLNANSEIKMSEKVIEELKRKPLLQKPNLINKDSVKQSGVDISNDKGNVIVDDLGRTIVDDTGTPLQ